MGKLPFGLSRRSWLHIGRTTQNTRSPKRTNSIFIARNVRYNETMQRLVSWQVIMMSWVVIMTLWLFGLWIGLPYRLWWFDVVTHFIGGAWALGFFLFLSRWTGVSLFGEGNARWIAEYGALVGSVMMIGVFWEFGEFIADRYIFETGFTYLGGVFEDTLIDLFMDFLGASAGFLIYRLHIRVLVSNS